LDLDVDLNHFPSSHLNPNANPTHLPKHEFLIPNNQFYQRIWYVEYYSVHAYMVWSQIVASQKFHLTPESTPTLCSVITSGILQDIPWSYPCSPLVTVRTGLFTCNVQSS